MAETVKIHGLSEIQKKLRSLPGKVQRKVALRAVSSGARVIRDDAKGKAPVDEGKLKANIGVRKVRAKNQRHEVHYQVFIRSRGIFFTGNQWRSRGQKGDPKNAYYWTFVEFGTAKMPARPFMRPAFDSKKTLAARKIKDEFVKGIDREAASL